MMKSGKAAQLVAGFFPNGRPAIKPELSLEKEFSKSFCKIKWYEDEGELKLKLKPLEVSMEIAATSTSKLPSLIQQQRSFLAEPPKTKEDSLLLSDCAFFGCSHYLRRCKVLCPECQRFFPCRVCHDKVANHDIDRHKIQHVFCYGCENIVNIGKECSKCKEPFGKYYCPICHMINDDPSTSLYHCDKCGICRQGKKENSYHCDKCQACYIVAAKETHPCRMDSAKDNCPVCRESIFSSRKGVWAGPCGHYMHNKCVLSLYKFSHFRCPLCQEPLISTDHPPKEILTDE